MIIVWGSQIFHFSPPPLHGTPPFSPDLPKSHSFHLSGSKTKMEETIFLCKSWLGEKHYPFEQSMQHDILSGAAWKMSWRRFLCSVQSQGALRQSKTIHWQAVFSESITICLPYDPTLLHTQLLLHVHPTHLDTEGPVSSNIGGGEMKKD